VGCDLPPHLRLQPRAWRLELLGGERVTLLQHQAVLTQDQMIELVDVAAVAQQLAYYSRVIPECSIHHRAAVKGKLVRGLLLYFKSLFRQDLLDLVAVVVAHGERKLDGVHHRG